MVVIGINSKKRMELSNRCSFFFCCFNICEIIYMMVKNNNLLNIIKTIILFTCSTSGKKWGVNLSTRLYINNSHMLITAVIRAEWKNAMWNFSWYCVIKKIKLKSRYSPIFNHFIFNNENVNKIIYRIPSTHRVLLSECLGSKRLVAYCWRITASIIKHKK